MMKKIKRFIAAALAGVMSVSLMACGGSDSNKGTDSKTLKVAMAVNPPTLDPWLSTAAAVRDTNRGIYEGLFELDENYEPKEQLCESYEVNEDYTVWTFKLRTGVKFHNGKEMKAEDVVASLNCWAENNVAAPSVITAGEKFEQVDEHTVKIELTKPAFTLLNVLTSPCQFAAIMPKEVVDARTDTGVSEYIGTGPMKFEEWKQDSYVRFSKYTDYKGPGYTLTGDAGDKVINFDEIYYYIVTDSSIRTAGIQSGEYDIAQTISYDDLDQLKGNSDISLVNNLVGNYAIALDKVDGPFENELVRQAAQYAINVDEIMAAAVPNGDYVEKYSSYMYKGGLWGTDSGSEYWNQQDTEKAKELLKKSGYDGTPITLLSTTAYPKWIDASLIVEKELEAVGFNVEVETYDWATMLDMKKDPAKFDACLLWWPLATVPTALKLNQTNADGWCRFTEVTEGFEKLNAATSVDEAKAVWSDINEFLLKTASSLSLGYFSEPYAVNGVKDFKTFIGMTVYGCSK